MGFGRWIRRNLVKLVVVIVLGFGEFGNFVYGTQTFLALFNIQVNPQNQPYYQYFFGLIGFAAVVVVVLNDIYQEKRKRLFGEPWVVSNGVREYKTRYDLPRLDRIFELAKKRILISGRALTYITYYQTQLVREAVKREVEIVIYILSADSHLAKGETLNPSTPNFPEQIELGLRAGKFARKSFPEEWRSRFRIFTYDPKADKIGSYIIIDPETEKSDSPNLFEVTPPDYRKGEWVKAERLHVEQQVQGRDVSHSEIQVSTWKDNNKFVTSQLKEFNASLKNIVEVTD